MISLRRAASRIAVSVMVLGSTALVAGPLLPTKAGADTDPSTLSGQGSSFLQPVVTQLLVSDGPNLSPLFGAYTATDSDQGIAAFTGSGPGVFSADYAVSERPLTSAEAATAKANGRGFAYVPIAATPVAIATLVPTETWAKSGSTTITSSDFCQSMPLTTDQLGQIFGFDSASPLQYWNDPRITCPPDGPAGAPGLPIKLWANLDPSAANYALMSLLDSTPSSKVLFQAGLNQPGSGSLTTDTTPSEKWPYGQNTIPGGDQPLIGKLLAINSTTNAPSQDASTWQLGATGPISSVWTRAPLGVPWNLATAAVQNAQGAFVAPSLAAAKAGLVDATLASTGDPTTNNLVTFNPNLTDATTYNSYLMEESYLVVPTNDLAAAKANALAQLIRFAVGPQGQQVVSEFGAAPDTPAMTAAGQAVATEINAEAVSSAATGGSTTTTTNGSSTTATSAVPATAAAGGTSTGSSGGSSSSSGLAYTGSSNLSVWIGVGGSLLLAGGLVRRRLRRREARS